MLFDYLGRYRHLRRGVGRHPVLELVRSRTRQVVDPSSDVVVDAEARLRVRRFLHRSRRESVGEVGIACAVEDVRVSVEVGPASAARAERRELEVRLVDAGALEYCVRGILVGSRHVVSATFDQPNVLPRRRKTIYISKGRHLRGLSRGVLYRFSVVPYDCQGVVRHRTTPCPTGPSQFNGCHNLEDHVVTSIASSLGRKSQSVGDPVCAGVRLEGDSSISIDKWSRVRLGEHCNIVSIELPPSPATACAIPLTRPSKADNTGRDRGPLHGCFLVGDLKIP